MSIQTVKINASPYSTPWLFPRYSICFKLLFVSLVTRVNVALNDDAGGVIARYCL